MSRSSTLSPDFSSSITAIYAPLRSMAREFLHGERASHSFDPTDLAHELILKLGFARLPEPEFHRSPQFIAYVRRAMYTILVDHARKHRAAKRGGGLVRRLGDAVSLTMYDGDGRGIKVPDLLDLHDAMNTLEQTDPELAHVVSLRFSFGLALHEIASLLDCSVSTVQRRSDKALESIRTLIDPPRVY